MSYSSISLNFVEKSFFFLELFQKNMRGVILTPLRFLRVNILFLNFGYDKYLKMGCFLVKLC